MTWRGRATRAALGAVACALSSATPGATLASALATRPLAAQSFRARIDAAGQRVSFRGLTGDSVARALAVADPSGTLFSPDGFRLRCGAGPQCYFFRPGPRTDAMPATASGSLTAWGFGVPGLSLRASGRLATELGGGDAVPTIGPLAQLLEGYAEYQLHDLRLRGGRQLIASRLEPLGFDGIAAMRRLPAQGAEVGGYVGWGLARASILPITDPALDPLDEWRPRRRQVVAGLEGGWALRYADLRAEYRREVDPVDHHFVSERTALSATGSLGAWRATTGFDYNIAEGRLGSGDLTVTYVRVAWTASAGVRRYRPYFSLWTLWGAFSPVGYDAAFASGSLEPTSWLSLRSRAERYVYEDAEISTGLISVLPDRGWRLSGSATARLPHHVGLDVAGSVDRGPGASSRTAEVAVEVVPMPALTLSVHAGVLRRPLELRYFDAADHWFGARAEWALSTDRRIWTELSAVGQERRRPDAGASGLDQLRARAGISLTLGSAADRAPLPPAVRPIR